VTKRRHVEEALREADRRKDEFLATLAHELRNPLAPIRTGLELLKLADDDRALADETRAMMEQQIEQMVRLIDDLLEVSRITEGKLRLRKERVELAWAIRSAVESTRPLIEMSGHELTVTLPPEPVHIEADPTRLAQVFANLLSNAAKYTPARGHIEIRAEHRDGAAVVSVRDNGIGIPAYHLPKLFEMFSQVDSALERSQGGLGIGLSLVRGLVEMHGGAVEAHSGGPGRGSEFVVRLPVAEPGQEPNTPGPVGGSPQPVAASRILIVDDNRNAAQLLGQVLGVLGHEARVVHDGLEAVRTAAEFRPRLVLLDIGMPGVNGYEAARRIRSEPWGSDMVLVALTGFGQEADRQQAVQAGFDHHLTKPVEAAAVQRLLAEHASRPDRSRPRA
jgi:CheY-like chemotaxis protein